MNVWLRWRGFLINLAGLLLIFLVFVFMEDAPKYWRITVFMAGWVMMLVGFLDFIGLSKKVREMYVRQDRADCERSKQP